ncbi:hypothetical protein Lupro_08420 [Lutibacter profundi]|uniref:Uncharacterized protein n=1 Tax=Lutibacter profundi TaxID=1622118 RepID=A0A120IED1_9FLAO|nr:PD40 domain-containing protein [Lutibacter profundi]AMC11276.1 hypothetical protein Lupro_08420 [Lutibacter profundi]
MRNPKNNCKTLFLILSILAFISCSHIIDNQLPNSNLITFGLPQKVAVIGYNNHIMEPFLSRDGTTLFFNNLNTPDVNTNLYYATKISNTSFEYKGEIAGVNTEYLEGVPTVSSAHKLYFVSERNYTTTLEMVYESDFFNGSVSNIQAVPNISKNQVGWVNFDVEISENGNYLYAVDGRYDEFGGPYEANLFLAEKINGIFQRSNNTSIFENINTTALEYAACISSDMLELYFTRVDTPLSNTSIPQIYMATRNSINEDFNTAYKINSITGFVEGPTISPDGQRIYYHKYENEQFVLYMVEKEE